jgi:putative transposase
MGRRRQSYSSEFKAKVARDALRENATVTELSSRHSISSGLVSKWKKQASDGLVGIFSNGAPSGVVVDERVNEQLYEQIGRLKMELEWLKKKLG